MKQMPDRSWLITVELKHGHHRYAFLVDGVLTLDPRAQGITRNDKGRARQPGAGKLIPRAA